MQLSLFLGLATMSMHMCKQRVAVTRIFCALIYCFTFQKLVFALSHTRTTTGCDTCKLFIFPSTELCGYFIATIYLGKGNDYISFLQSNP